MTTMAQPPPRRANPPAQPIAAPRGKIQFSSPQKAAGHRIVLYGQGGIGKTTLASLLPGPVAFIDLDESLGRLGIDAPCIYPQTWRELRDALNSEGWDDIKTVVVDTATKAEELAAAEVVRDHAGEIGKDNRPVSSIEGFGYGKGYMFLFEKFLPLLADLDRHVRAGRNVALVCHDCTTTVPNPGGEDWLRYEPRLSSPGSGKGSVRLRVREWADHVLFLDYDINVGKDGKGKGGGSRTLYRAQTPHCMAKSRTGADPIPVDENFTWGDIIK